MLVSGGYCQHTEGFGEMAQGAEPLAKPAGAERNSVSPLIAVALSEPELRSSHPHPAGAPRAHLSRPAAASIASTSAGPCDAILGTCDAEDRRGFDYFFFRRFVVFFAAAFFAFLFFAIAALLA
jgi:hypothetical protein